MAWFKLNGIELAAIAAAKDEPDGGRRPIGSKGEAGDGTMRKTRQTLKRDLKFKTIPLSGADAYSWECFINGEGETWSFNANTFGSKGSAPSSSSGNSIQGASTKFGGGKLRLAATTGFILFLTSLFNPVGESNGWTVMVWRLESGTWHHYIVRSDGAKWLDGVRADATVTTWLVTTSNFLRIENVGGAVQDYDDLVALPFKILDAWGPIFGTATTAFSLLPALNATGDLVREQATRSVLGEVTGETIIRSAASKELRKLDVEIEAV